MPLPVPNDGESQQDFLERGHKALAAEFTDTDQRNAVLFSQWRKVKGESEEEKKAHARFSDDQYVHLQNVPVFKEHSYLRNSVKKGMDGKWLPELDEDGNPKQIVETYDLKALKAMVENCNRRVRETTDFAPITDIHTGKRMADGRVERPEVFGFGGPFRLGMYGNEDRAEHGLNTSDGIQKGKWSIFQDEFWFKDKAHKAREMPRRSAEVYVGRPMEDRFLDPVTALGAETPALDMGIHYNLNSAGDLVERYSAPMVKVVYAKDASGHEHSAEDGKFVSSSGGRPTKSESTVYKAPKGSIYSDVPGAGNNKAILHDTEHAKSMVKRLDDYERTWINHEHKNKNASEQELHRHAMHASGLTEEGLNTARAYAGKKASMKPGVFFPSAEHKDKYTMLSMCEQANEILKTRYEAACMPGATNVAIPEEVKTKKQYGESTMAGSNQANPDLVSAVVSAIMETEPMKWVCNQMQAAAAPVNENKEILSEDEAADKIPGENGEATPPEPSSGPLAGGGEGKEAADKPEPKSDEEKSFMAAEKKPDDKEKYSLALRELQTEMKMKYDQQQTVIKQLSTRLESAESKVKGVEMEKSALSRSSKLQALRHHGYMIDVEKEIQRCSLATMNDSQFQTHMETLTQYAQQSPVGVQLFIDEPQLPAGITKPKTNKTDAGLGLPEDEVKNIVQYQLEQLADGKVLSWAESKEAYAKNKAS